MRKEEHMKDAQLCEEMVAFEYVGDVGFWVIQMQIYNQIIKMITAHQLHKYSVTLFTQLHNTDTYQHLKTCLYSWRDSPKTAIATIIAFQQILHIITLQTPNLHDDLNRCIIKDFHSPEPEPPTLHKIKKIASENTNSLAILEQLLNWLKIEQPIVQQILQPPKIPQLEQLSQQQFTLRLQKHERSSQISKMINLYRRCVITVGQFKKILQPIYFSDPSFFNMLYQYAEELESKRRKVTIFAPLNELVDQKYPLEQVGNSYIIIPDGYANWGLRWSKNELQSTLNRICVSVPLGTQGSFVITRKNEYEQQLLRNQEQKYEIDSNLASLHASIRIIQKTRKLTHPLVQKILGYIYTGQIMNYMMKNPQAEIAKSIVLPRLKQKLMELTRCRAKFQKACQEVAAKNFYKSLDYRCFYFCKNDKKFNCPARWQKEIQLRKQEIIKEHRQGYVLQIQDRQSLQHSRYYVLNSFDNITTQQLLPEKRIEFKINNIVSDYPRYPHNQILFLLDFTDKDLLNDVLEILLFHTQKKSLLELMIFKIMRINIQRKMHKDSAILAFIDGKSSDNLSTQSLNDIKTNRKMYKDLTDQFLELIEEEIDPTRVEELPFPFEGPQEFTFLGTKQCYFFLRYLLTIYQRFSRAKSLSQQKKIDKNEASKLQNDKSKEPAIYDQFLTVLIHKLKQQKGLQEYLRKIYQQDAFIFFTLDKLILGVVKLVNNINMDSLTYKILKEGVRDYDMEIRRWQDYPHPTVTQQLTKLCRQSEMLFRFSYNQSDRLVYVSAWQNEIISEDRKKKESDIQIQKNMLCFLNNGIVKKSKERVKQRTFLQSSNNEYIQVNSCLMMRGEQMLLVKRKGVDDLKEWQGQLSRIKKLTKI